MRLLRNLTENTLGVLSPRGRAAMGLFLGFFALYLFTMTPSLAPYRDTGEFALSTVSLGVSHPPSYPLYVLLGHLASLDPFGTPAYAVAVLSALAGAGTLAALFLLCAELFGPWAALAGVLLLGADSVFWSVCIVQEMYSLTLLFAALLLAMALRLRRDFDRRIWYCAALCFGLFLGNRTDILLWAPGLVLLAFPAGLFRKHPDRLFDILLRSALFGALGLSVYLYLMLRSVQGPWLDWNHPAELPDFIGSITRRGYGGTLDLLSKNYAMGAMFLPNMKVYGAHLWRDFGALGGLLAACGLFRAWRADRRRLAGTALLYLFSGPVFIFLANLPPNPHAMAIVEPHYLLSDMVLALWAAEGALLLAESMERPWFAPALALLVFLQPWVLGRWGEMDRRHHCIMLDWADNVFRSTPPGSILVAKKDVQIFALWYYQRVEGRRTDLHVVAQGLAHSPWYRASHAREGSPLRLGLLRTAGDFQRFIAENPLPVYATMDAELPAGLEAGSPSGLVLPLDKRAPLSERPWEFMVRRGIYRYAKRPEFFTSDLVGSHVTAAQYLGVRMVEAGRYAEGERDLMAAWSMKRRFPDAPNYLGFLYFKQGRLEEARKAYENADRLYQEMIGLTKEYYSLPGVTSSIRSSAADSRLNLGVVYEKLNRPRDAEAAYMRALDADPKNARAHYNIAVLYWKKDWDRVISELAAALRADPGYDPAKKFMGIAMHLRSLEKK